ncbi:glycosyltransferase [Micromonospora arborensis]|uniref:glycosyltransferase n=1 Tax=Micromonospora arborensis TaxID=2116518 RepID=UPI0033CE40F5
MVTRERPRPLRRRPTVSVVVPCYNYGRYLPACVQSILSQEGVDVDVLIVDDASPDGSAEVARTIAVDPRVQVIEHVVNQGHLATYNEGLAKATGDYLVLLSADDLLTPGSLARATALLEAHPEVGFVYGFSAAFNERTPVPRTRATSWTIWTGAAWLRENCERATNPVSTPEVVMRASVMHDLKGYDSRVPHAADFLLWLRAAARAHVGRVNGVDQAFYRVHGANMHVQEFGGMIRDITERNAVFEILFTEEGDRVEPVRHLHTAARSALARTALSLACRAYERNDGGDELPERLADLAESIDAEARGSRLWRRYERNVRRGRRPERPARLRRLADRVDRRVRWGWWRWRGIRV